MNKRKVTPWIENVGILGKHLEKNEKWFQKPEEKIRTFEKNANKWNDSFLKQIKQIEAVMKRLEKEFEG
ncbi:hypothetical protein DTX80_15755 [Bacilli bacterium]|nr:hypothetical protein WH51_04655 [Bacilli bacterium VT-13-104]PZD83076.1 hypothetical protein DEJ64_16300 [Bacilli bacterium]PZD86532.1 hypothetical protein DEJ60_10520 [Bacilli bacterium]PZD90051.1 hypothetical protein DEJ66_10925 [Bacilli bacterium]RCO04643.1 hypothetical protein DTX80_15755 [Bacilli bacterium]